ncbi:MAG: hypothetical protein Q8P18_02640 [Pseudomonadota bacterium]|nr:hypothetical protein [Pseudomonadota bacterium]
MSRALLILTALGFAALVFLAYTTWTRTPGDLPTLVTKAPAAPQKAKKTRARPPAEKACLPPPSDVGPEDMVASAGLDPDAVRTVMRAAANAALPCFVDSPSVVVRLSINVACTGRVAKVDVEDDGGATAEVQGCIQGVLRAAEFPAHALPDGDTFACPLRYTAPG